MSHNKQNLKMSEVYKIGYEDGYNFAIAEENSKLSTVFKIGYDKGCKSSSQTEDVRKVNGNGRGHIRSKYNGRCKYCGVKWEKGELIAYDRDLGPACIACDNKW